LTNPDLGALVEGVIEETPQYSGKG